MSTIQGFKIHHGSIFHIPICQSQDIFEAMDRMKKRGIKICAAHLEGSCDYFDLEYKNNIAIVIGTKLTV